MKNVVYLVAIAALALQAVACTPKPQSDKSHQTFAGFQPQNLSSLTYDSPIVSQALQQGMLLTTVRESIKGKLDDESLAGLDQIAAIMAAKADLPDTAQLKLASQLSSYAELAIQSKASYVVPNIFSSPMGFSYPRKSIALVGVGIPWPIIVNERAWANMSAEDWKIQISTMAKSQAKDYSLGIIIPHHDPITYLALESGQISQNLFDKLVTYRSLNAGLEAVAKDRVQLDRGLLDRNLADYISVRSTLECFDKAQQGIALPVIKGCLGLEKYPDNYVQSMVSLTELGAEAVSSVLKGSNLHIDGDMMGVTYTLKDTQKATDLRISQ